MSASGFVQIGGAESKKAKAERMLRNIDVRPQTALVYVENGCHLKCSHCYESEETHPKADHLSLDDYARIFKGLANIGVLNLTLSGGEIFLRRDLLDIVELARNLRFNVHLFTSGTLLTAEKCDRIKALNVGEVQISLYSADPAVHDGFTNIPGSHKRTLRGLALLQERGIRTVVKANVMTFNVDNLDDIIALAKRFGARYEFDPTVHPKMNGDRSPLQYAVSPEVLRRKVFNRPDLTTAFQRLSPGELCRGERTVVDDSDAMCGAAKDTLAIGADGGLYACSFFPVPAGNLKANGVEDIWFGSAQLDEVRRKTFGDMTACSSCDVRSTCAPCKAYGLIENDDMGGCNAASRQAAEALHQMAAAKDRANQKMERGRALPLVGDATFEATPLSRPILVTE